MLLTAVLTSAPTFAAEVPSRYGVDAPELARLGERAVGYRILHMTEPDQIDVLAYDPARGTAPRQNRGLTVDLWYPALPTAGTPAVYTASFPAEPPAPPVSFGVPGIAVRDAPPATLAGGHPWVLVSHGYSNDPAAMTWITENLASKGYVVAAIRHADPPITDSTRYAEPLLRRPLDIVFAAAALRRLLVAEHLVDPARLALLGYSMGGYGVLTAAGAVLDPGSLVSRMVPGRLLEPYARGGALQTSVAIEGLRAVIAIAPAGGGKFAAWGTDGLLGIETPLLLIAGDSDRTVDYATGARAIFESARHARRYLLTFKGAGHSIGLNPAPDAMRTRLWDQDWFEDSVWRKQRVNAINAHFITAFLDDYLKGDGSRAAYLDVPVTLSDAGLWPATVPGAYDAFSPGSAAAGVTFWKGFQRNHAAGLEMLQAAAAP